MAKDEKNKKNKEPKNSFLKESKAELKKVNWPKPKRLANDTATVIGIVLIVAVIVFILDFIFLALDENLIIKAEEKIKQNNNTSVEQVIDSTTETDINTENTSEGETTDGEVNLEEQTSENTEVQNEETQTEADNSKI